MIKVFLVEDEIVIREGIKKNIPWEENGLSFVGDASDGELAFPMIQKLQPDIVITDIKMPFMDGLSLSTLIKKEFPLMEIIILSGFEEFDYAKEAINVGVSKFLTKPISSEDLLSEIKELAVKIEEKKSERLLLSKYQEEMEESNVEEKRKLFTGLVSGEEKVHELLKLASSLSIDLSAFFYNIILFGMQSSNHTSEEYSNSVVKAFERIQAIPRMKDAVIFDRNLEGWAFLIKADTREEIISTQNMIKEGIEEILEDYPHISYYGGIGREVERLHSLPDSFRAAARGYAHRYLADGNAFRYADEESDEKTGTVDFDIKAVDARKLDKTHLASFLKTGNLDEVPFFVDEFYGRIGEDALKSMMFRQYLLLDAYFTVVGFLNEIEADTDAVETVNINSEALKTTQKTKEYIIGIVSNAIEQRNSTSSNRYRQIVDEAIDYIAKNYADEDLSLNSVSSYVNVSPNHFSMIFSQQTDSTFIKYLTDYRMNKAKEMLRCTNKRSSEIASETGYKDPHYFSFIFKKTQGMTPTQYRGVKESEGDD